MCPLTKKPAPTWPPILKTSLEPPLVLSMNRTSNGCVAHQCRGTALVCRMYCKTENVNIISTIRRLTVCDVTVSKFSLGFRFVKVLLEGRLGLSGPCWLYDHRSRIFSPACSVSTSCSRAAPWTLQVRISSLTRHM